MTVTDEHPTRDDLIEKLNHLVNSARRCAGTPYYDRWHGQINDTLDDLDLLELEQHGTATMR